MATKKVEYIIELRDKFTKNLKKADKVVNSFNSNTSQLRNTISSLAPVLGAAGLAMGVKTIINLGIEMEKTRVAFSTFLRDGEKANKLIAELNEFANITPFNNQEVIKSGRVLLAASIPADKITKTLKAIGDVSAGANVPLTEMSAIYSKAMNKGRVQAEELNQLAERGVPILQTFSDMFGVSTQKVMEMGSQGKLTSDKLTEAFTKMTSEGGIFFNLMEKQSATLGGKLSTIQGKFQLLGMSIGENNGILKEYADKVIKVVDVLQRNQAVIERTIRIVGKALKLYIAFKGAMLATRVAIRAATIANNLFRFSVIASNRGLKSAIRLTKSFNSAMKANVIGLVVTALGFLISKLVQMRSKTEDATAAQEEFNKKQDEMQEKINFRRMNEFLAKTGVFRDEIMDLGNGYKEAMQVIDKTGLPNLSKAIKTESLEDLQTLSEIFSKNLITAQRQLENLELPEGSLMAMSLTETVDVYKKALSEIDKEIKKFEKPIIPLKTKLDEDTETGKLRTQITSAAPKVININIGKLIETQEINTETMKESTPKIKRMVTEALLEALNDSQLTNRAS